MLLVGCNAVHMFGMDFPLDVIFVGKGGEAVDVLESLKPWKRTKRIRDARFVLELPTGVIAASCTEVGDRLAWMSPEPVFPRPKGVDNGSRPASRLWSQGSGIAR